MGIGVELEAASDGVLEDDGAGVGGGVVDDVGEFGYVGAVDDEDAFGGSDADGAAAVVALSVVTRTAWSAA